MKTPLVTIITIVYNGEAHINRAVQSVLGQSYQPIEYIIIDGGSTDGTLAKLSQFNYPQLSIYSEPDNGISDAFNKGLRKAKGDIIGLLNADDWYNTNTVAMVVEAMSSAQLVYGDLQLWRGTETDFVYTGNHTLLPKDMTIAHPTVFLKQEVIAQIGLFMPYKLAMDYDYLLRCFKAGVSMKYLPTILTNMQSQGTSDRNWAKALKEVKQIQIKHLGRPMYYNYRYFKRLITKGIGQFLNTIGLKKMADLYRQYFSLLPKRSANQYKK